MSIRKPPDFTRHPVSFSDALKIGLFRGICYHVVDGDTADFMIDLGFYHYTYSALRFKGIDTPELRGTTGEILEKAKSALRRVQELVLNQCALLDTSKEEETFGRFVASLWIQDIPDLHPEINRLQVKREKKEAIAFLSVVEILIAEGLGILA